MPSPWSRRRQVSHYQGEYSGSGKDLHVSCFEPGGPGLEAYQANSRAVNANPFDIYGRFHFAESALTLETLGYPGKGEEAIEEYLRLISVAPQCWLSHFLLGRAYVEVGEPEHAVGPYSEAIGLNPRSALFYDRRAEAQGMLGEYALAVEDYSRAIELGKGGPSAFNRRGVALFALGRFEEAIRDFDQELDALYQMPIIRGTLGLERFDEPVRANRELEKLYEVAAIRDAVRLRPEMPLAYNSRGSAYYQLGLTERAIEDYDSAIQLSPSSAELYANRAFAYERLNKHTEAKRDFQRAIQLGGNPDSLRLD